MKKGLVKICTVCLVLSLIVGAIIYSPIKDEPGPIGEITITANLA